jgi:uncharacterized protein YehS (DUF1456 family)
MADTDKQMINFMQVIPDSQFYTTLDQILSYAESKNDKYQAIAIRNTINNGYVLTKKRGKNG